MSHSGSHTPTHNPAISNIVNSPQSTTSRPQILDDTPSERPFEDRGRPPVTPSSLEPQIAESSTRRRPGPESSTEKPMAKRIRRESPQTRGRADRRRSGSPSDSQTEMAVEKVERPEPLAPTPTSPKKKRTRTLTTPQQSAVLHALLAKSRFPTTAMREDVGRSIGLSARKVQNQRQKARRPRSQSDAPLTRPPQYGPFPNAPGPVSGAHGFEGHPTAHMSYTTQSTISETQSSQSDTPARLLGPGMPGPAVYAPRTYQPMPMPSTSAPPIESRFPGSHTPLRSESPQRYRSPRSSPHTSVRPATSQPSNWYRRDPLRTLPPLLPSSSYSTRRIHSPSPYMSSRHAHGPPRPISPESRFAHIPPESSSRPSMSLPPPFAMQPSPQWNEASFQSVPRPISSPWSRTYSRSTIERSTSVVTSQRERPMGGSVTNPSEGHHHSERSAPLLHSHLIPPSSPAPVSRPGRYDPVRATFITRSTPTLPRVTSPAQQSGEDNEKETHSDRKPPTSPRESH
ncbi:hypothetical protein BYT27DRAFT_7221647 [Phlegmacium glaucopus]|nr:hypothetical protein BYT27DRAFT_7221647 [Phlegmacium glaucopus]